MCTCSVVASPTQDGLFVFAHRNRYVGSFDAIAGQRQLLDLAELVAPKRFPITGVAISSDGQNLIIGRNILKNQLRRLPSRCRNHE